MYTLFHTGWHETILFQTWCTDSWPGLCVACVAVAAVAATLEAVKSLSASVSESYQPTSVSTPLLVRHSEELLNLSSTPPERGERFHSVRFLFERQHVIRTLLHIIQMTLGYILMLIVMTFNVSLLLSVITGSSVGNFVFSSRKSYRVTSPVETDAK